MSHVLEFKLLLDEAVKLLERDFWLDENAGKLAEIREKTAVEKLSNADLKRLILETCNLLEESPAKMIVAEEEMHSREPLSEDDKFAIESANWHLDTNKEEREQLIEQLLKLVGKIEK